MNKYSATAGDSRKRKRSIISLKPDIKRFAPKHAHSHSREGARAIKRMWITQISPSGTTETSPPIHWRGKISRVSSEVPAGTTEIFTRRRTSTVPCGTLWKSGVTSVQPMNWLAIFECPSGTRCKLSTTFLSRVRGGGNPESGVNRWVPASAGRTLRIRFEF